MKPRIKRMCFAYDNGRCRALKQLYCRKETCGFYKAKRQFMLEFTKVEALNKRNGVKQTFRLCDIYGKE